MPINSETLLKKLLTRRQLAKKNAKLRANEASRDALQVSARAFAERISEAERIREISAQSLRLAKETERSAERLAKETEQSAERLAKATEDKSIRLAQTTEDKSIRLAQTTEMSAERLAKTTEMFAERLAKTTESSAERLRISSDISVRQMKWLTIMVITVGLIQIVLAVIMMLLDRG